MTTDNRTCGLCNGTGRIDHHDQNTGRTPKVTCPTCSGSGKAPDRAGG